MQPVPEVVSAFSPQTCLNKAIFRQPVSIARCMDKQDVVHLLSGILSSLKIKGILAHATMQTNLTETVLSEISQKQMDKYCMIPLI